ncbi:MAG: hypothetical protein ACR2N2_05175 [Acidimicrobiia bacterium]
MVDDDITRQLADVQKRLLDLPDDAFEERYELRRQQDELRSIARSGDNPMDRGRSDEELLAELASLRDRMKYIEKQRIDLVQQAGSGGATSSEMGNLGGVQINKGIDDAMGLGEIKNRIGILKGILQDRGIPVPPAE